LLFSKIYLNVGKYVKYKKQMFLFYVFSKERNYPHSMPTIVSLSLLF
jgi:hypothetical protein